MWCLSRESQSNKPQQPMSKNPGPIAIQLQTCYRGCCQKPKSSRLFTTQSQSCQDHWNQKQSTQGSYCKNRQPQSNVKNKQPVGQQTASRHKRRQQGQPRGSSLPRNSQTRTSTKGQDRLAWQRLHRTSIQMTRMSQQW